MSGQEYLLPPQVVPPRTTESGPKEVEDGGFLGMADLLGNSFMGDLLSGGSGPVSEESGPEPDPCAYEVQPGDNLWDISRRQLGRGGAWRDLYEQNRGVVGDDPHWIYPGQVLDVCGGGPEVELVPEDAEMVVETVEDELLAIEECLPEDEVAEVEIASAACGPQTAEEVMGAVGERLVDHDLFGAVTDEEAGEALDMLLCLPPDQQAVAMDQLDDEAFDNLLAEVPEERHAEFEALFQNTTDPARKVRIWGELEHARAQQLHDATLENTDALDGDEEDRADRRNDIRDETLSETNTEVDDEVQHVLNRIAAGESVTATEIDALDQRKQLEARIESQYGVNLTNDRESSEKWFFSPHRDRRVWTTDELHQIEGALGRMPLDHVRDSGGLEEIHRRATDMDPDGLGWKPDAKVGGDSNGSVINVYDTGTGYDPSTGTNTTTTPWRTQSTSDNAHHRASGTAPEGPLSLVEEVITHELGHSVHQNDDALWHRWRDINGWERLDEGDLEDRLESSGMSEDDAEAQVETMDGGRKGAYDARPTITKDGKLYQIDPYSGDYLGVDAVAVPGGSNAGEWDYARSNPEDHFAEMYAKAVHQPEGLFQDLMTEPQQDVVDRDADRTRAQEELDRLRADPAHPDTSAAETALQDAQQALDQARHTSDVRQQQWSFFRSEVFHTDDSDIQALVAPPGKEAIYAEYQARAYMCQTPQQLSALREEYRERL